MIPHLAFNPPVIAHRGAGLNAPENTLASVREAKAQGAKWIEFDVKITYDGIPILMHDETLERTTTGQGFVAEATWETLQNLDAGVSFDPRFKGEKIPLLVDVISAVLASDMSVIVEIKPCPGRAKATTMVTMIEMAKIWPDRDDLPVISSFDLECLEVAAQLEPHWPRCVLMDRWDVKWRDKVDQVEASAICVYEEQLTQARVQEMIGYKVPLLAYTVQQPERAKELLDWGVAAVYAGCPRAILDCL
ncbi:MAG: glycerophosphodiester phosphodiesterase family protein [Bdellovibrionales bacterium]|jgi:glycerophosphoryl diester phosphodiesterase